MHLDEEQVQRLLHGELSRPAETSSRQHLAACSDCRGRVDQAKQEEDEIHALLRQLDHAPPRVAAGVVAARAAAGAREPAPGWGRWAAGILVALALAGASYAVPGSPVPAWVAAVVERIGGRPEPAPLVPAPMQAPDSGPGGIAVAPGRELLILFTSPQAAGQARVSLTDGAEVVVRAPIGAATFTSDVDRLVIDNSGPSATFEIQIPRLAPRVEIQVNGDRIFLKHGSRVATRESQDVDSGGPFLLPLTD